MRMLKQACLSMFLVVLTLVAVSILRFNLAPAQQGQGEAGTRSGDTNCDGKIDITDPIIVLNWLFGDGPEPCAIAQEQDTAISELRQSIEALRQEIRSLPTCSFPNPVEMIHLTGEGPESVAGVKAFTVPEDKVFVLTDLLIVQGPAHIAQGMTEIRERSGQSTVVHRPFLPGAYSSAIGIAFQPGSEVIIRIDDTNIGCEPTPCNAKYDLRGYLRSP